MHDFYLIWAVLDIFLGLNYLHEIWIIFGLCKSQILDYFLQWVLGIRSLTNTTFNENWLSYVSKYHLIFFSVNSLFGVSLSFFSFFFFFLFKAMEFQPSSFLAYPTSRPTRNPNSFLLWDLPVIFCFSSL